jgi:hypothetical protein
MLVEKAPEILVEVATIQVQLNNLANSAPGSGARMKASPTRKT